MAISLGDILEHHTASPPSGELLPNADFSQPPRTEHELAAFWAVATNPDNANSVEIATMDGEQVLQFVLRRSILDKATDSGPAFSADTVITSTGELRPPQPGDQFTVSFDARLDPPISATDAAVSAYVEMIVVYASGPESRLIAKNAIKSSDWTSFSTVLQVDPSAREIKALYINVGCHWENGSTTQQTVVPEVRLYVRHLSAMRYMPGVAPQKPALTTDTESALVGAATQVGQVGQTAVVAVLPGLESIIEDKIRQLVPQMAADLSEKLKGITVANLEAQISKSSWGNMAYAIIIGLFLAGGLWMLGHKFDANLSMQREDIENTVTKQLDDRDQQLQAQIKAVQDQRAADAKQRESDSKDLHNALRYMVTQSAQLTRSVNQEMQVNRQLQTRVKSLEVPKKQ